MGIPRQFETQQVHYLRRDFSYLTANLATGVLIGTVPSGSRIVSARVFIDTAFNGTSPAIQGGTAGTGTNLFTNTDAAPTTPGVKVPAALSNGGAGLAITQDQDLFLSATLSGATAGAGCVTVEYIPLSNGG